MTSRTLDLEGLDLEALIGARVRGLSEYAPEPLEVVARRLNRPVEALIKLDANENPYGPPPAVREILRQYTEHHRYPDAVSRDLRAALGAKLGVDPYQIVVGNGSDELIDLLLRLFRPDAEGRGIAEVISCPPTFGMYQFYGVTNDLRVIEIPRLAGFGVDVAAIEALSASDGEPRILFLASPNNPDGALLPAGHLRRLLALPILVVLDEAYVEFAGASRAREVNEYPNLVVLRTFSKWAGLAGLRVGYGAFPRPLMEGLWRLKSPYNVNGPAQAAALATLANMLEAEEAIAAIVAERERVQAALDALTSLSAYPSAANFVLVDVSRLGAPEVQAAMEAEGIILRYFGPGPLANCVRMTVGTPQQNDECLAVWRALDRAGGRHG